MSEQIALGVQSAGDTGVQYDQRLFNMSAVSIEIFFLSMNKMFVLLCLGFQQWFR